MATTLNAVKTLRRGEATMAASILGAFFECSPAIQAVVREMTEIVRDEEADPEDVEAAINTLVEALFPEQAADACAADDMMFASADFQAAAEELDAEHDAFADRVRRLMDEKGLTQDQLGREMGIGQSAVSNILTRKARPQRRTVAKFAVALGVAPEELWPENADHTFPTGE